MLKLGTLTFDIDDYPSELPMGGASAVDIKKYAGGRKSIQDFGAFDDPLTLTGTFNYTLALQKHSQVDAMWRAGVPVQLVVSSLTPRWVLITAYKPVYKNDYTVDYSITLEPIDSQDLNAILYGESAVVTATPASTGSSSASTTTTASPKPQKIYIVKAGDTLWGIAAKPSIYGDGSKYTKIVTENNIKNPSLIYPGQKLVIP